MARFFATMPGWTIVPEVSFSIYGERGVIDILAWHAATRCLLVIELKTLIVDVQALVGDVDRKRRLARRIARERGWDAASVSSWVIVVRDATNERRVAAHRTMLRAALPTDGRAMRGWLLSPEGVGSLPLDVATGRGPTAPEPLTNARRPVPPAPCAIQLGPYMLRSMRTISTDETV